MDPLEILVMPGREGAGVPRGGREAVGARRGSTALDMCLFCASLIFFKKNITGKRKSDARTAQGI